MIETHGLPKPLTDALDKNEKIVRYLSLAKFHSLLFKKTLFFSPISSMTDKHEGTIFTNEGVARLQALMELAQYPKEDVEKVREKIRGEQETLDKLKTFVAINCWNLADHESFALWKIYVPSGEGVAIRTSRSKLVSKIDKQYAPYITQAMVRYASDQTGFDASVFFKKHLPYRYEGEYRLALDCVNMKGHEDFRSKLIQQLAEKGGLEIPLVDLNFIDEIIISPFVGKWFFDVVENLVAASGAKCKIVSSAINDR